MRKFWKRNTACATPDVACEKAGWQNALPAQRAAMHPRPLLALAALAYFFFGSSSVSTMPNVVGQQVALATSTLRNDGLIIKSTVLVSSNQPNGVVVSTNPPAGASVKKGDAVDVVILNIDSENKRISLGLKQAEEDPWLKIGESYPVGTALRGRVAQRLRDRELPGRRHARGGDRRAVRGAVHQPGLAHVPAQPEHPVRHDRLPRRPRGRGSTR